ncbi:flagella basal body P-ring formation protein FlgA [Paramagnetospirillum kuznetsovii]|uniref:Flagella basal body P-ring formation protein FlgA n=1 Tax=Paramagnetospirillum kuznetsovii TaxID=2053833 RepID=A0A364NW48_9PROT|nr:flagellar basal body P-ring formation chaperone FlgA [Paramagnetospirillum kuznetsovii]RAU21273.1 flagella basal body P-ring formation protein FlgA [Paramagnetospirillum kuznetsovii]
MTRSFARASLAALAVAASVALGSAAGWAASLPPSLKPAVVIEGDVIRLGDLWDNLGDKAETPLANAPQPGKRVTLETRWLAAVAQSYGIDWRPANAFERSVVERSGQTVDSRAIETEIKEALRLEGAPINASVEVTNRASLVLTVPSGITPTIGVRDVIYDQRMNRFSAVVEVPAGSPTASRVKVMGNVFASARIPVLARPMGRGDTITEADIQWVDVREEVIRRDVVTGIRQLIGQEPRYQLRAGAPIRTVEVQKPVVVAKNSAVTMIVRNKFMTLTAQGRAVEDGSTGDVIRVTNIQSKQTVDAKVEGAGQVSVIPGGMRALAN